MYVVRGLFLLDLPGNILPDICVCILHSKEGGSDNLISHCWQASEAYHVILIFRPLSSHKFKNRKMLMNIDFFNTLNHCLLNSKKPTILVIQNEWATWEMLSLAGIYRKLSLFTLEGKGPNSFLAGLIQWPNVYLPSFCRNSTCYKVVLKSGFFHKAFILSQTRRPNSLICKSSGLKFSFETLSISSCVVTHIF